MWLLSLCDWVFAFRRPVVLLPSWLALLLLFANAGISRRELDADVADVCCWADIREFGLDMELVFTSDSLSTPSKLPKTRSLNAFVDRRNISKFFFASAAKPHDVLDDASMAESFERVPVVDVLLLATAAALVLLFVLLPAAF